MRTFLAVIKIRMSLFLQYRMAAAAGVFTQIFFGFMMIMAFDAFYSSNLSLTVPMSFRQVVSYIWLGQAFLGLFPWNGDRDMQAQIKSGQFAYEFLRPVDIYNFWYARIFAQRVSNTLLRCIALLVIAFIIPEPYRMTLPTSWLGFLFFSISLILAVILGCSISNIITISTLFTIGDGFDRLFPALITFFSGMVIPIMLFPEWSQIIFRILPFSGLTDTPYRFYLGLYSGDDFLFTLVHSIIWTLVFVSIGKFMVIKARNSIVVQGG